MKRQFIAQLFFLLTLFACGQQSVEKIPGNGSFTLPFVVQASTKDIIELSKSDFLNHTWFQFHGKYKFRDTLHLDGRYKRDTSYMSDYLWEYSKPDKNDSLTTDGFQIFTDYNTTIYKKEEYSTRGKYYFPVYVVNETSNTKVFIGKDDYVFGLQEAVDTSDNDIWRPIECKAFDFCGNGYFGLKVHPGEFIMFLVPKYEGDEKSLMRIRLQIGESLYLSQSFTGTFNRKQLVTKKETSVYDGLESNKTSCIRWMFYGAVPKGYDEK